MKRSIARVTAAATALFAPLALATVAPATAGTPVTELTTENFKGAATLVAEDAEFYEKYPEISKQAWVQKIKRYQDLPQKFEDGSSKSAFDNVHVYMVHSPSMNREIPVAVIQPHKPSQRDNAPTQYLLNGADGGEGRANWIQQTDVIEYYGGNPWENLYQSFDSKSTTPATVSDGVGANIVIPMAGAFSYYSDWENEEAKLGGKQMWETFITAELPQLIEPKLNANGKRGIAGLSMSGTSTLNFAQHDPNRYDTIGSFSGCAATTTPTASFFINETLKRGGTNMDVMWGGTNSETARFNDPLLNAEKLREQKNIYVSNGSGWAGPYDLPSGRRLNGNIIGSYTPIVEGGVIEAATNTCTHELRAKTDALGIPVTYNFRPQGTHQWGYWEEDMRHYWPVMQAGLETTNAKPEKDPYLDGAGGGLPGSAAAANGFGTLGSL